MASGEESSLNLKVRENRAGRRPPWPGRPIIGGRTDPLEGQGRILVVNLLLASIPPNLRHQGRVTEETIVGSEVLLGAHRPCRCCSSGRWRRVSLGCSRLLLRGHDRRRPKLTRDSRPPIWRCCRSDHPIFSRGRGGRVGPSRFAPRRTEPKPAVRHNVILCLEHGRGNICST